jgi:hypothetical protein
LTVALSVARIAAATGADGAKGGIADAATRCMAMVAYAEAAGEGGTGMAAVIRVIRNRVADGRFPGDPCAVVAAPGEFQPVTESPRLRLALKAPAEGDLAGALADFGPVDRARLDEAVRLASDPALGQSIDPTGGALYFVNPRFMEPAKCPWFAQLKRTGEVGRHVFMTHYAVGDPVGGPALDCALVKKYWASYVAAQPMGARRGVRWHKNPAWIVNVDRSPLAEGRTCSVGTYDPETRSYAGGGAC